MPKPGAYGMAAGNSSKAMARKHADVELVYKRLRERLLTCRILPGARINISAEASRLAVSPGAVRDALSRLTAENLAVLEPFKGFTAAALSCGTSRDFRDALIEIKSICLRLSLQSADVAWERALAQCHWRLVELEVEGAPPGADAWEAAHTYSHDALLAASRRPAGSDREPVAKRSATSGLTQLKHPRVIIAGPQRRQDIV